MEIIAGLSVGCLILTALLVAIKTFALWSRTRGTPELMLAMYLTCCTVIGYPLTIATTRFSPAEMLPLHLGVPVLMSAGVICLLFFTLKVFRPAALWARVLVALAILMLATGGIAFFFELTSETPRPIEQLLGVNLINTIPIAFAYFWATGESLGYYRQLRLRLRLGLAEVAIVNRVLLWGLMTLAAGIAVVIGLIGMVLGTFLSAPFVLAFSCLGIAHASCLFLAFHPPGWYTDWLTRRTPAEAI